MTALVDLLTDPDAFFADVAAAESPSLRGPILVVSGVAVVSAASSAVVFATLRQLLPAATQSLASLVLATALLGAFLGPFVVWPVLSGVFHGISSLFDGAGGFRRTLVVVGWGFLPAVAYAVVSLGFTVVALRGVTPPTGGDPAAYAAFARRLQRDPLLRIAGALHVVFTLWQGSLWTFGLRRARGLSLRESAMTVGGPVLLLVAWNVFNLL